jgi:hypothetical protein
MSIRVFGSWLIAFLFCINLFAADEIDFTGTWMFNEEKSVLDDMGMAFIPYKLVISKRDSELTVQKSFTMQSGEEMVVDEKMTLDGKECKSEIWNSPRITTANWSATGDTLNVEMKITFNQDGNTSEMLLQEAWIMQNEGNLLVIKHFSSSNWGERKITMAYNKQEVEK